MSESGNQNPKRVAVAVVTVVVVVIALGVFVLLGSPPISETPNATSDDTTTGGVANAPPPPGNASSEETPPDVTGSGEAVTTYEAEQPDGTTFEVHIWMEGPKQGGYETKKGYTVVQNESDGWWYYVDKADGKSVVTDLQVAVDKPIGLEKRIRPEGGAATASEIEVSSESGVSAGHTCRPWPSGHVTTEGTENIPVLLGGFSDRSSSNGPDDFEEAYFGDNPGNVEGPGSAADFYREMTDGKLELGAGPDGVNGWYNVGMNSNEISTDTSDTATDAEFVRSVIRAADSDVDFSAYDDNGDGCVAVAVVYQGFDRNLRAYAFGLSANGGSVQVDGVTVNAYTRLQELDRNGERETIGTLAHEVGHFFALPDLYGSSGPGDGIGYWSLMALGSWGHDNGDPQGSSPPHITAWEKNKIGWGSATRTPRTNRPGILPPAAVAAENYRIEPDGTNSYDYYLEYRKQTGFDRGFYPSTYDSRAEDITGSHIRIWRTGEWNWLSTNPEEIQGTSRLDGEGDRPFKESEDSLATLPDGTDSGINIESFDKQYSVATFNDPPERSLSAGKEAVYALPVGTTLPDGTQVPDKYKVEARAAWGATGNPIEFSLRDPTGTLAADSEYPAEGFGIARAPAESPTNGGWKLTESATQDIEYISTSTYPAFPLPTEIGSQVVDGDVTPNDQNVTVDVSVSSGGDPYRYGQFGAPEPDHFDVIIGSTGVDSGEIEVIEQNESEYTVDVSAPNLGTGEYDLEVTFTDRKVGVENTVSVTKQNAVVVNDDSPTASFTFSPSSPSISDTVTFDASGSSDSDGAIQSYDWDFGDGTTSTGEMPSHSYSTSGTYTVTLTVTDDDGATDTRSQTVSVTEPNSPPTASFTFSPNNPDTSEVISFDGSSSSDADGNINSYEWDFNGDGTTDATGQTATRSYSNSGEYTVTLTVIDQNGATDTTSKTVSVSGTDVSTLESSGVNIGNMGETGESAVTLDAEDGLSIANVEVSVDTSVAEINNVEQGADVDQSNPAVTFDIVDQTADSVRIEYNNIQAQPNPIQDFEVAAVEFEARTDDGTTQIEVTEDGLFDGSQSEYSAVETKTGTLSVGTLFSESLPGFNNPPTNTQELDPTLYEDVSGDGDGTDPTQTVTLWTELVVDPQDFDDLTQEQIDALDWNGDGELTPEDAVTLWTEQVLASGSNMNS